MNNQIKQINNAFHNIFPRDVVNVLNTFHNPICKIEQVERVMHSFFPRDVVRVINTYHTVWFLEDDYSDYQELIRIFNIKCERTFNKRKNKKLIISKFFPDVSRSFTPSFFIDEYETTDYFVHKVILTDGKNFIEREEKHVFTLVINRRTFQYWISGINKHDKFTLLNRENIKYKNLFSISNILNIKFSN